MRLILRSKKMGDIFEKVTGLNLSGDTYESEQRYKLIVAGVTGVLGFTWLPISAVFWAVTAIKLYHWYDAYKRHV